MATISDKLPIIFQAVQIKPTSRVLTWSVLNEELTVKGYNLYYSESPGGLKEKLNTSLLERAEYKHTVANYSHFPRAEYIVEAILDDDSVLVSSTQDLYTTKDQYAEVLMLRALFDVMAVAGNIPVFVYPRKRTGTRCDCTPPGQSTYAYNCTKCFGTSFVGGYHDPIVAFIHFLSPDNKTIIHAKEGVTEDNTTIIQMPCEFIMLNPYDAIREYYSPQPLYLVQNIPQINKFNTRPITQVIQAKQADSSHPLYKVEMPFIEYLPDKVHYKKRTEDGVITCRDVYAQIRDSVKARP